MTRVVASVVFALPLLLAAQARAQADLVRLEERPVEYTDVIDAADEGDAFDINVRVGFRWSMETAAIRAERPSTTGRSQTEEIARYDATRNELLLGLDIGLFRDLALFTALPLVLNDDRRLETRGGATDLLDGLVPGDRLVSPTRSGIDTWQIGLAWSPLNQYRRPHAPTWVVRAMAEIAIGDVMRPCVSGEADCGISEGTHSLSFEMRMSHRFRYAEPYGGAGLDVPMIGRARAAMATHGDLRGYRYTRPPIVARFDAGLALIPWEDRGHHQRLTIDVRLSGEWRAEGRGYSPLYDALGTSSAPSLANPTCEGTPRPGSVDCTGDPDGLRLVPFLGVTDVQAHGRIGGRIALNLQAAEFVRFGFGAGLMYTAPHLVTGTPRCNTLASLQGADDPRATGCVDGIIDPHHRAAIDTPGQRFSVDGQLQLSLFATALAQF